MWKWRKLLKLFKKTAIGLVKNIILAFQLGSGDTEMETLKKLEEINKPDTRNTHFVIINHETGEKRSLSLEDFYKTVELIKLHERVPDNVRSQFNVARNLAIYTWFCYAFHQISELKAYSTLEMALRIKLDKGKVGLKKLLIEAVESGLIKDRGFRNVKNSLKNPNSTEYVKRLPELMPRFRNELAHGSTMLNNSAFFNLQICADFINQLFI